MTTRLLRHCRENQFNLLHLCDKWCEFATEVKTHKCNGGCEKPCSINLRKEVSYPTPPQKKRRVKKTDWLDPDDDLHDEPAETNPYDLAAGSNAHGRIEGEFGAGAGSNAFSDAYGRVGITGEFTNTSIHDLEEDSGEEEEEDEDTDEDDDDEDEDPDEDYDF